MNKKDETAFRLAVEKHWKNKTDEQMARGMPGKTIEEVRLMRESLNLKGKESLKEYAKRYLLEMPEAEKREFMKSLPSELIWRMAEGSPATSGEITVNQEPVRIDITHQLLKVYGPRIIDQLPDRSESSRLPAGPSK